MEADLSPYLRRVPVDVSPRVLAVAVTAICFVLGSGLAVAAMGGDVDTRAIKYDAKPPAFAVDAPPEPEPVVQPRLADLMAEDAAADEESAAAPEPLAEHAAPAAPTEIERLRARRQAARRARIRARWRARNAR